MRKMKIIWILSVLLLVFSACGKKEEQEISLEEADTEQTVQAEKPSGNIYVYVCGAVETEGVYELTAGSRAYQAIEMAGGFRGDAATAEVNQAEVLTDEARLYVPTIAEVMAGQAEDDGKVNINTATKEELMSLPGVGESRADSIIAYRKEQGAFQSIEDIMQISGIKEGLFDKIKDLIKI